MAHEPTGTDEHDDDDAHSHRGHGGGHEEGGHGEPWLVSYADLMTLLFGFFVLMYSFEAAKKGAAQDIDPETVNVKKELARYFGGSYVDPLDAVAKDIGQAIESAGMGSETTLTQTANGFKIEFTSTVIFRPGETEIGPKAKPVIETLAQLILVKGENFKIRVEGYTDDSPVGARSPYPSNWELSAARAASVVRIFEGAGHNPENLTAIGFGSTRALGANRGEDGKPDPAAQARNRRVVLYVVNDGVPAPEASATPGG